VALAKVSTGEAVMQDWLEKEHT